MKRLRKTTKARERGRTPTEMSGKPLTPRELEVAELIAIGRRGHEIAEQLEISQKTADTHRLHILIKLGLNNSVEIARYAIAIGWVTVPAKIEGGMVTRLHCITCRRRLVRPRAKDGADPQVCVECRKSSLFPELPAIELAYPPGPPLTLDVTSLPGVRADTAN